MSVPTTIQVFPSWIFNKPDRPLVWLITGCSSGLGLSLTRQVQAAGHRVVATSRSPQRTPDLVDEVTKHPTNPGQWLSLNVDHPTAAQELVKKLEAEGSAVDVLVNNAGWSVHHAVEHFTDQEVRAQFETLFFGPLRLIQAVVSGMRRRRFGVVVNISSGAALEGRESMGTYASGKAALDNITRVLAKEVAGFNVRTLTVLLGSFNTSMANSAKAGKASLDPDYQDTMVEKTIDFMDHGTFVADGDTDKAARVVYEVVVGEGVGAGHEAEMLLPLGREIQDRVKLVRDRLDHCWEVFGDVAMNVRRTNE